MRAIFLKPALSRGGYNVLVLQHWMNTECISRKDGAGPHPFRESNGHYTYNGWKLYKYSIISNRGMRITIMFCTATMQVMLV